jgi:hypothetical protein
MNNDDRITAAEENLTRQLDWHSRFDSRALLVLGIDTGMLGYLASILPEAAQWSGWSITAFAITAILLAGSLTSLFVSNRPDTVAPAGSALFFGTIASMSCKDFHQKWLALTGEAYLADVNEQVHRNAEIICNKFKHLKYAMRFLFLAIIPWVITVALLHAARANNQSHDPVSTQRQGL